MSCVQCGSKKTFVVDKEMSSGGGFGKINKPDSHIIIMKLFIIKVTGLVQGVNFRYYAKKKADELGIFGYVKNLDDGSVEILCSGKKSDLDKFIEWCNHGPQYAEVKNVEIKETNLIEEPNNFEIRY